MDSETLERLLVGPVADRHAGPEPLVRLLTAVRAAPRPAELRGEIAAMHAFRRALAGTPLPTPLPSRSRTLARLTGLKVALAGLAVAAAGGVALVTGTLPVPLHGGDPAPAQSAAPPGGPFITAAPVRSDAPSTKGSTRPSPGASMLELCRAYQAGAGNNPGRALDNPAFSDLIASAGGRDEVAGYCERVVRDAGAPTAGHPDPRPAGRPSGRPSDKGATPSSRAEKPAAAGPARVDPPGHARANPPGHARANPPGHARANPPGHARANPPGPRARCPVGAPPRAGAPAT
ncbi:hypothetical protein ABZ807_03405 [Micromonospora sp. NPDC047548]|uniref:hypothetical protein n=1 Tax=Micromonospora sp. NPDC047548 TaxID=3155624 RepID=UPI003402E2C6